MSAIHSTYHIPSSAVKLLMREHLRIMLMACIAPMAGKIVMMDGPPHNYYDSAEYLPYREYKMCQDLLDLKDRQSLKISTNVKKRSAPNIKIWSKICAKWYYINKSEIVIFLHLHARYNLIKPIFRQDLEASKDVWFLMSWRRWQKLVVMCRVLILLNISFYWFLNTIIINAGQQYIIRGTSGGQHVTKIDMAICVCSHWIRGGYCITKDWITRNP